MEMKLIIEKEVRKIVYEVGKKYGVTEIAPTFNEELNNQVKNLIELACEKAQHENIKRLNNLCLLKIKTEYEPLWM
jgi:hypothetical protein